MKKNKTNRRLEGDSRIVSLSGAEGFFDSTLPCAVNVTEEAIDLDMESGIPLKCWRKDKTKNYCEGQFLAVNPIRLNKKNNFYPFYCSKCYGSLYLEFKDLNRLITWFLKEAK